MLSVDFLGIDLTNAYFQAWFCVIPIFYIILALMFRQYGFWSYPTKKGSRTSDLVAFEIVSGLCVIYIASCGIIGWFELINSIDAKPKTFFSKSTFIENHLIYPMMSFQTWNLVLCFILDELNVISMFIHHIIVVASCQGTLKYKIMQYYALYMYGVLEVTNIFLAVMDIFKLVPVLQTQFYLLYQAVRLCFIVSYIVLRVICLPYYMSFLFSDCLYLLKYPNEFKVELSSGYLWFIMLAGAGILILQYIWGWFILQSTMKFLKKSAKQPANTSIGNNEKSD